MHRIVQRTAFKDTSYANSFETVKGGEERGIQKISAQIKFKAQKSEHVLLHRHSNYVSHQLLGESDLTVVG